MLLSGWEDLGKSRIAIQVFGYVVMWEVACECLDGLGLRLWERSCGEAGLVYLVTGRWRRFADPC